MQLKQKGENTAYTLHTIFQR